MNDDLTKSMKEALNSNDLLNATKKVDKEPEVHVGKNEFKAMKKQNYEDKKHFTTSYVIQNKKTKQIVEIKAVSPLMAAKTVGWRPRHVKVLRINE